LLAPGSTLALAAHCSSGFPAAILARGRDSSNSPLMGFGSSSWCIPKLLPFASRRKATLVGFLSLQRLRRQESTSLNETTRRCSCLRRPETFPSRNLQVFPHTHYGVAHRFSQPLSDLLLSSPSRHFRAGNALGIRPSGVCSFCEVAQARRL